ncbi:MAG TPA: FHA domain-containing protein [Acidobacteriota bacterium]|nr:FHA domain-containing protein [Acidobacteriota bacterium]
MTDSQSGQVRARLFCQTGDHKGEAFFLGSEADIGSAAGAKITIRSSLLAGRQARIKYSPQLRAYVLENLSPSQPLLLDGRPVERPRRLGELHVLTFPGGHDYIFQVLHQEVGAATSPGVFVKYVPSQLLQESERDPSQRPEPKTTFDKVVPTPQVFAQAQEPQDESPGAEEVKEEPPPAGKEEETLDADTQAGAPVALPSLQDPPRVSSEKAEEKTRPAPAEDRHEQARSRFILLVAEEGGTARSYPLKVGKNVVGRMDDCQVVLGHKAVSRRQAVLLVDAHGVVVSDLGGLNATLVDGQPLQGEVEIQPGQELRIGPFRASLVRRKDDSTG